MSQDEEIIKLMSSDMEFRALAETTVYFLHMLTGSQRLDTEEKAIANVLIVSFNNLLGERAIKGDK